MSLAHQHNGDAVHTVKECGLSPQVVTACISRKIGTRLLGRILSNIDTTDTKLFIFRNFTSVNCTEKLLRFMDLFVNKLNDNNPYYPRLQWKSALISRPTKKYYGHDNESGETIGIIKLTSINDGRVIRPLENVMEQYVPFHVNTPGRKHGKPDPQTEYMTSLIGSRETSSSLFASSVFYKMISLTEKAHGKGIIYNLFTGTGVELYKYACHTADMSHVHCFDLHDYNGYAPKAFAACYQMRTRLELGWQCIVQDNHENQLCANRMIREEVHDAVLRAA